MQLFWWCAVKQMSWGKCPVQSLKCCGCDTNEVLSNNGGNRVQRVGQSPRKLSVESVGLKSTLCVFVQTVNMTILAFDT